ETNNNSQTHYQLFVERQLNDKWSFNTGLFLTRGLGYYENYKGQEAFDDYGLPDLVLGDTTITHTDLVRQKWLDNYFYGQIISAEYKKQKHTVTLGGGWTVYDGVHHGDIAWAQYGINKGFRYYDVDALKTDINLYVKWQYALSNFWNVFTDVQYRNVRHKMDGFSDNPGLFVDRKFDFVNPKAGVSFRKNGWQAYLSYALANKEPNRDDFEASLEKQPKHE